MPNAQGRKKQLQEAREGKFAMQKEIVSLLLLEQGQKLQPMNQLGKLILNITFHSSLAHLNYSFQHSYMKLNTILSLKTKEL